MSKQSIPILTLTFAATGAVTANRFIKADGTLAGVSANTLGVTRVTGVAADNLPVDVLGTAIVETGAAVTLGATVSSDSTGRAVPWATGGAKVGIALQAASAAGAFIEVLLIPNAA